MGWRWLLLVSGLVILIPTLLPALPENLDIDGYVRLRLRFVDSDYQGKLFGTYGEEVKRGISIRHRLLFEASYPFNDEMRVGGLIRISNEDKRVIKSGPDYLSSEFGSGYFEYNSKIFGARLGYFQVSFTPLSLMRWDLKDDPEGGGGVCPVCGGPGVGGALLGETLEELGPKLGFEGLRVTIAPIETAVLESYLAYPSVQGEAYPVKNIGARLAFKRYVKSVGRFAGIEVTVVRSEDDHASSQPDTTDPFNHLRQFTNSVYSISWQIPVGLKLPIVGALSLTGEWTLTESKGKEGDLKWDMEGEGGVVSLEIDPSKSMMFEASYIYLSPHWDSYFRSLSYNANRRGPRLRLEYGGRVLAFAIFAKYLETIDRDDKAYPTLSARFYFRPNPVLDLGFATIFAGEATKRGTKFDFESKRTTIIGSAAFKITRDSSINFEQRYVSHKTPSEDYGVSLTSLFVKARIW